MIKSVKSNKKRQTYQQKMDHSNLILSVPPEVRTIYMNHLDLKSSVMFSTACKATLCNEDVDQKKEQAVIQLFGDVIKLAKEVHSVFCTSSGRDKLLARMLRKLIFVSVTDINSSMHSNVTTQHCMTEYHTLYNYVSSQLDVDIVAFNNMLEDAQFEYRGFCIIGLNPTKREQLNVFKKLLEDHYFSKSFTVHTYLTYGNMFVEINVDNETISFDIHKQKDSGGFNWLFLQDTVMDWMDACDGDMLESGVIDPLYTDYLTAGIYPINSMLGWSLGDEKEAMAQCVIAKLVKKLLPYQNMFGGSTDAKLEIWNDTAEHNWLLAEIVEETQRHEMYTERLRNITFDIQDEFNCASLL